MGLEQFFLNWLDVIPSIAQSYYQDGKVLDFWLFALLAVFVIIFISELMVLISRLLDAKGDWLYEKSDDYLKLCVFCSSLLVLAMIGAYIYKEQVQIMETLTTISWFLIAICAYSLVCLSFLKLQNKYLYEKK